MTSSRRGEWAREWCDWWGGRRTPSQNWNLCSFCDLLLWNWTKWVWAPFQKKIPRPYSKGLDYATGAGYRASLGSLPFLLLCCWDYIKAESKKATWLCKVGVTSGKLCNSTAAVVYRVYEKIETHGLLGDIFKGILLRSNLQVTYWATYRCLLWRFRIHKCSFLSSRWRPKTGLNSVCSGIKGNMSCLSPRKTRQTIMHWLFPQHLAQSRVWIRDPLCLASFLMFFQCCISPGICEELLVVSVQHLWMSS